MTPKAGLGLVFINFHAELNFWIFSSMFRRSMAEYKINSQTTFLATSSQKETTPGINLILPAIIVLLLYSVLYSPHFLKYFPKMKLRSLFWSGLHVCGFDVAQFQRSIICRLCFCPPLSPSLFSIPLNIKLLPQNICFLELYSLFCMVYFCEILDWTSVSYFASQMARFVSDNSRPRIILQ